MQQTPEKRNPDLAELRVTTSCSTVRIEIPEITSERQRLSMVGDLYELCRNPPAESRWVIDLTRLKTVDISLVGVLVALAEEFGNKGRDMTFAGLNAATLPPDLRGKLIQWLPDVGGPSVDGTHPHPRDFAEPGKKGDLGWKA